MKPKLTLFAAANVLLATVALAQEHEPAGHAAEAANPFAGTIFQSAAAIIVFLLLLALLKKFAWGPILKGLQDRESKIKADLQYAEAGAKKAAATLKEYQEKLAAAQTEALKIMDQSRLEAQRLANQIKEQAQVEITAIRQRAESDIRVAKEQALAEIYTTTATLATEVASKILRRQINAQDQQQLVQESLAELSKADRR